MKHLLFTTNTTKNTCEFPVAILIKTAALEQRNLVTHYLNHAALTGLDQSQVIAFDLQYENNKAPVRLQKTYLSKLLKALDSLGTTTLYCCDSNYFKTLTKQRKAEPHYGYVLPCAIEGFEHMQVVLGVNYQALFYNPEMKSSLDLSLTALSQHLQGSYQAPGKGIIESEYYPKTYTEIENALNALYQYPELTCDIEAFGLKPWQAGIATIGFAWDQHNGLAFPVDYVPLEQPTEQNLIGGQIDNHAVKSLLTRFFETYPGKITYHNANFDVKILIWELFMADPMDEVGKQKGIEVMTTHFDDTKLITYLATNSTTGNKLSLKDQAHEFAGNYAQEDIKDIRKIPLDQLLRYNVVDCLSTWFVYNKHWDTLVADQQRDVYDTLFKPSVKLLLQMELTGMPLNMEAVIDAEKQLQDAQSTALDTLRQSPAIQSVQYTLTRQRWINDYESRKAKAKNPDKIRQKDWDTYPIVLFNPGSSIHVQALLYGYFQLPVLNRTDTGQPAVDGSTLNALKGHTQDTTAHTLIDALLDYLDTDKILNTFIKAFKENSYQKADGWYYLFGNFNLGGTVSGRLSSSGPNLQNIPSNSRFAKVIKQCFSAPKGWLFVGADFALNNGALV